MVWKIPKNSLMTAKFVTDNNLLVKPVVKKPKWASTIRSTSRVDNTQPSCSNLFHLLPFLKQNNKKELEKCQMKRKEEEE